MTEANGSVDAGARPGWRWDVALSFAGAQRDYVDQVAQALTASGVRCFYDADEEINLWGKYLAEELPAIYGEQAAAVVIFVSADYAARDWTRHERRAALGRAIRERREYVLPARFDDTPLPGLLPDVSYVDLRGRTPQQFAAMISAKLGSLGISPSSSPGEAGGGPPGGLPVAEADPRRLGVHAAISVPGISEEVPPEYVPRDADAAEHGVRATVAAAAERGGFVLLVGGSSVGKTRSAVEAVKALLPEWWLVHPAGPTDVAALAVVPPARTVVWLDELQRYLDGEHGLTGGVMRALLGAPHPVVIIGTLWPDRYAAYTTVPAHGGDDPYSREREVLDLAAVIRISAKFSRAEQDRAHAAAARDLRLREALGADGYGLTQTLAAAPQLVARWEDACDADPYAWAVLTAALDVARLGGRAPLSPGLLRGAAPGYCTSAQQAEAPDNWFEQALAYATKKLHGAAAALTPAGTGMGQIAGYTVADYLIQHASRERRTARPPTSTWDALLTHLPDRADAVRLANSARDRLLYRYAIPLYRHAADAGDQDAVSWLLILLADRGDLDELRDRADAGDKDAARYLAGLLAEHEDLDELRDRADAGDASATLQLNSRLADRGDLDELRDRADAGDVTAGLQLASAHARRGDLDAAEQILRTLADADEFDAALRLISLDGGHPQVVRAGQILRIRTDDGDWDAASDLTRKPPHREGLTLDELRDRADSGDRHAVWDMANLLAEQGDLNGAEQVLRTRADKELAAEWLAHVLGAHGDVDRAEQIWRTRADAGDWYAGWQLANLLAKRGDLDELRARAEAGDENAAVELAGLLAERGNLDDAEQILCTQADAGDGYGHWQLADLLAKRGDLGQLSARAEAGDENAAVKLADLLVERGNLDDAEQILLASASAGRGDAERLVELLIGQGRGEEAERLRRFGLNPDGSIASA